ncbi:SLAM family member 9-like isoform X2 [Anguilla rostrata]|uniref:SLAM family member 9-like isoform X2 n=1 Tax=Anguilla rostrata TaxID=7938 RepID=UPI0030D13B22
MINFKAGLHFILFFFFSGLCSVETEVKTVSKKEGETVSLHSHLTGEQTSPHIIWLFYTGSSKKIIAQLNRGEFASNYSERFRDRLQLDRQTWSLNFSNLNSKDTGVYSIQTITNVKITELKFYLIVYSPVPKPVISHITLRHSVSRSLPSAVCRKSCSVLCSVRNEREVVLSWQKEGETLNSTSSPDLNSTLSLPLETEDCSAAYTCVAENPVSNQTVPLNTEELCPMSSDAGKTRSYILPAVMISVVVIAVIGVTGFVVFIVKQLKYKKLDHTGKYNETDIFIGFWRYRL